MKKIVFLTLTLLLLYGKGWAQTNELEGLIPINHQDHTERIAVFYSDIEVHENGKVRITERILVYSDQYKIKRGIFRQIPLCRVDSKNRKVKVNFDIISILCDGENEEYFTKNENDNQSIYIGKEDYLVSKGFHTYTIIYETQGQVGFFDDYDEIYWNITGNEWDFKIENALAVVKLPQGAKPINYTCYTGEKGSTKRDCSFTYTEGENKILVKSLSTLHPEQGITVAVSFPRDIVKRPPPPSNAELLWMQHSELIGGIIALLILGIFYFVTWRKVGKDPEKPVVIPRFSAPDGFSPASTRYIYKRKFDDKIFTATILSLAVKGVVRISYENKIYSIEKIRDIDKAKETVSAEEQNVYAGLFTGKTAKIAMSNTNHSRFSLTIAGLKKKLQTKWEIKEYFKRNGKYIAWGLLLNIIVLILYLSLCINEKSGGVANLLITAPFVLFGGGAIMLGLKAKIPTATRIFLLIWGTFFSIPSLISVFAIPKEVTTAEIFTAICMVEFFLYVYLIKAPTEKGAETYAELEGFKMYLETAEEHRLNMLTPPEHTPELFEKMLPYAVALGVENKWGEKFTDVLKQFNYKPKWYNSTSKPFIYSSFGNSFAHSFTSSAGKASINPTSSSSSSSGGSWSSGSSGGGSSGGGGGGGGGGGW